MVAGEIMRYQYQVWVVNNRTSTRIKSNSSVGSRGNDDGSALQNLSIADIADVHWKLETDVSKPTLLQ